jgi:ring-1,2-phenylacetyl-CoA epoxidase subunit PaaA
VPLDSWVELIMANAFTIVQAFACSATSIKAPRLAPEESSVKVDKEETFHLRHGENWMKRLRRAPRGAIKFKPPSTGCFVDS